MHWIIQQIVFFKKVVNFIIFFCLNFNNIFYTFLKAVDAHVIINLSINVYYGHAHKT